MADASVTSQVLDLAEHVFDVMWTGPRGRHVAVDHPNGSTGGR